MGWVAMSAEGGPVSWDAPRKSSEPTLLPRFRNDSDMAGALEAALAAGLALVVVAWLARRRFGSNPRSGHAEADDLD